MDRGSIRRTVVEDEGPVRVVDEVAQKVALESVAHAEDLLDVAVVASSRGHFGISRSLAILGLEEAAKAFAYRTVALGSARFPQGRRGRNVQRAEDELPISETELNSLHAPKHAYDAGIEVTLSVFEAIGPAVEKGGVVDVDNLDLRATIAAGVRDQIESTLESLFSLNRWKNEGLYVGRAGAEVRSPRLVDGPAAEALLERLRRRLAFVGPLVRTDFESEDLDPLLRAVFGRSYAQLFGGGQVMRADTPEPGDAAGSASDSTSSAQERHRVS